MKSRNYNTDPCDHRVIDDDGREFSGGDKHSLWIARALYTNGGVMVLDDTTVALDVPAERVIHDTSISLAENFCQAMDPFDWPPSLLGFFALCPYAPLFNMKPMRSCSAKPKYVE